MYYEMYNIWISGRLRVERYLKEKHNIVGYSDTFYKGEYFNNKKF